MSSFAELLQQGGLAGLAYDFFLFLRAPLFRAECHPAQWLVESATVDPHPVDGTADTRKQQAGDRAVSVHFASVSRLMG
jgi:hypothetical protein